MPLRILRKPQAAKDILAIWEYIAADSLRSADRVVDAIEARFQLLAIYLAAGLERPELGKGLRSFPEGRFSIFYRYDAQILDIVRVVAAARKLSPDHFDS